MSFQFTATSSQFLNATTPVTGPPLTLAAWIYKYQDATQSYVCLCSNTGTNLYNLLGSATGSGYLVNASGTFYSTGGPVIPINTWTHMCGVSVNNTTRYLYINGVLSGNSSAPLTPVVTNICIGGRLSGGVAGQFNDGMEAEVGVWNVALASEEVESLANGMTCDKIRPQNLRFYAPLVRDLIDYKGGITITNNNGATASIHPRVYA